MIACHLETQWTGPPYHITKPDIDLVLKRSSSCGVWPDLTFDWSCGPQFASVRAVILLLLTENFTHDLIFKFGELVNAILNVQVPQRYLITHFAVNVFPFAGCETYFASMLVIVAISGCVDMDNHVNDPTINCILALSFCCIVSSYKTDLILSTGKPLL